MFDWPKERQKLKDEILRTLREQRDTQQTMLIRDTITINPTVFSEIGQVVEFGPFFFNIRFNKAPVFTFGQKPETFKANTTPFIVEPFVSQWTLSPGTVDGFYLGVYALTLPSSSTTKHYIYWRAEGKGSRYRREVVTQAWSGKYNHQAAPGQIEGKDELTTK